MMDSLFGQILTLRFAVVCLLTVVAFSILIKLGLWQLARAEEKNEIEQRVSQREEQGPVLLTSLSSDQRTIPTGLKVKLSAAPVKDRYLLLDNQHYAGQVGYLALQLVEAKTGQWVLIERGFVAAPNTRTQLPTVEWLTEPMEITGRLYRKSLNPLSQDLMMEQRQPSRIQNLNFAQLEALWQLTLEPYVVQPLAEGWPYPQPWQPVSMNAEKHFGYAVQWFSMATALVVLSILLLIRTLKQGAKDD
ncbi:SURF1 family protein [Vibrio salilacus]|uniref:SURF1 family protein n=2 Tax=Vibrio salilacus TaxID=1323749 RepID=UPI000C2B0E0D|nr:SURF1 family protein [Vibrio salilacus]